MARPTTPHGAHHACDWNALPHELQVQILRRCDFLDKVRGEGVCKAWKKLLQDAQDPDVSAWGEISLDLEDLFSKATREWTPKEWFMLSQATLIPIVRPVCRWLWLRAGGITALTLTVAEDAFGKCDLHAYHMDDLHVCRDDAGLDLFVQTFMGVLAGMLRDEVMPLYLEVEGRPAVVQLLSDAVLMGQMVWHMSSINLSNITSCVPLDALINLCSLQHLHTLRLDGTHPAAAVQAVPPDISCLTELADLELSFPNLASPLTFPDELTTMQGLTALSLHGFTDFLRMASHLPRLRYLSLGNNGAHALKFPSSLGSLTDLRVLDLRSVLIDSSFLRVAELCSLYSLQLDWQPEDSRSERSGSARLPGLACLTALKCVCIQGLSSSIDLAVLSSLVELTRLDLSRIQLQAFACSSSWQRLQDLSLCKNRLTAMPTGLSCLTALTSLEVRHQSQEFQIAGPLEFFKCMPGLQVLDVTQNMEGQPPQQQQHVWSAGSLCFLIDAEMLMPHQVLFIY